MRKHSSRVGLILIAAIVAALAVIAPTATARPETAKATTVRIWSDADRFAAVSKVAKAWGAARGVDVQVVQKQFGNLRTDLATVQAETAPDVLVAANDWTGELAANGLVVPIVPRAALKKQFPKYTLDAFSYGRLYGAPVATENIGLVVNTRLAKVPKTFAQLEKEALAFKRKSPDNLAIAVTQNAGTGDPYHMFPFFSGLCGYVFGKSKNGALNKNNLGIAAPKFLKNASLIDKWNREGLVSSKIGYDNAKNAFLKGNAAFWITGPWEADTLKKSGLSYRIIQMPKIKCRSVPFVGEQGFMVTKYANTHGVASLAKDLVSNYMMTASVQREFYAVNGRPPANRVAARGVSDPVLAQFNKAGVGAVPLPNIPQMASVWSEWGNAWVKATKGAGATPARAAFVTAARNIKAKIG